MTVEFPVGFDSDEGPVAPPAGHGMLWQMRRDDLLPLLEAAREGDDVAVRELVRRTQPMVWRLCHSLGSPGEEEDLVQETFLRALRAIERYRGDAPVLPWLLSIGRHVCADHVRRRVRQRRLADRLMFHAETDRDLDVPNGDASLGELVDALDPDRRDAFVLTQVVGLSYEEAAATLDCPIGTIRSRVARARADLVTAVRLAEAQ
jgi:RNA polymerase sigma-70 factor (ECF subfamily)